MLFFVASFVKTSLIIDIAEMLSERNIASFRLQNQRKLICRHTGCLIKNAPMPINFTPQGVFFYGTSCRYIYTHRRRLIPVVKSACIKWRRECMRHVNKQTLWITSEIILHISPYILASCTSSARRAVRPSVHLFNKWPAGRSLRCAVQVGVIS